MSGKWDINFYRPEYERLEFLNVTIKSIGGQVITFSYFGKTIILSGSWKAAQRGDS